MQDKCRSLQSFGSRTLAFCFSLGVGAFSVMAAPGAADDGNPEKAVVDVVQNSFIPSHDLAMWIMDFVRWMLNVLGVHHDEGVEKVTYTVMVLIVAVLIGIILQKLAVVIARKIVSLRNNETSQALISQKVFRRCSHIIPPLVYMALIPFAFSAGAKSLDWILRIVGVYTLVTFAIAICAILKFAWLRFDERENTENHPLKGVLNVCEGLVWIIIVIISISVIIDKSPMTLLAGLGAFAAALMLIFKDSILGFVAGIQLSQNDMLRVGDWITVPSTSANGIVMDVTLTVVKVQNFDNTMIMLPPYTLVSTSFQNWRNMSTVGYRIINHNIFIDRSSVVPASDAMIADIKQAYPSVAGFIEQMEQKREASTADNAIYLQEYSDTHGLNGTIDTNLGLFRAYACSYLMNHPKINHESQDMLMSMGTAESYGITLNVYCASVMTGWAQFEALKSEVIEHLTAVANRFGLVTFNEPNRNTFHVVADTPQTTGATQGK